MESSTPRAGTCATPASTPIGTTIGWQTARTPWPQLRRSQICSGAIIFTVLAHLIGPIAWRTPRCGPLRLDGALAMGLLAAHLARRNGLPGGRGSLSRRTHICSHFHDLRCHCSCRGGDVVARSKVKQHPLLGGASAMGLPAAFPALIRRIGRPVRRSRRPVLQHHICPGAMSCIAPVHLGGALRGEETNPVLGLTRASFGSPRSTRIRRDRDELRSVRPRLMWNRPKCGRCRLDLDQREASPPVPDVVQIRQASLEFA